MWGRGEAREARCFSGRGAPRDSWGPASSRGWKHQHSTCLPVWQVSAQASLIVQPKAAFSLHILSSAVYSACALTITVLGASQRRHTTPESRAAAARENKKDIFMRPMRRRAHVERVIVGRDALGGIRALGCAFPERTLDFSGDLFCELAYEGFLSTSLELSMADSAPLQVMLPWNDPTRNTLDWSELHVSKNARKRAKRYTMTVDAAYDEAMRATRQLDLIFAFCASPCVSATMRERPPCSWRRSAYDPIASRLCWCLQAVSMARVVGPLLASSAPRSPEPFWLKPFRQHARSA